MTEEPAKLGTGEEYVAQVHAALLRGVTEWLAREVQRAINANDGSPYDTKPRLRELMVLGVDMVEDCDLLRVDMLDQWRNETDA